MNAVSILLIVLTLFYMWFLYIFTNHFTPSGPHDAGIGFQYSDLKTVLIPPIVMIGIVFYLNKK